MRIVLFSLIVVFALSSCKSYLDPKFPYTEPLCEFTIDKQKYNADSSFVVRDTFRLDSATLAQTTSISFFEKGNELLKIDISGRSIGSFEQNAFTKIAFSEMGNTYNSTSAKITVWEYSKTDSVISADFIAQLQDSQGNKRTLTKGLINNVRY
jgi:hypothetical protein